MTDLRVIEGGWNNLGIEHCKSQVWPLNRAKGDFRKERRAAAESELRTVICGHCQKESRPLDGPTGRAWWNHHKTVCQGFAA